MIQPYWIDYFPPFPVLEVALATPTETDWIGPFLMFVDSGADVTIIPEALIESLDLPVERTSRIRSQWGAGPWINLYRVDIRISDLVFPGVEIAGDPVGKDAVLGRDILNFLDIRLNGPARLLHLLTR